MALTKAAKEDAVMEFTPFGAADKIKLTVALVQNTICVPTRLGHRCSATDAVKFIMMCQAQRLNPYAGDCVMTGYDNRDKGPQFSMVVAHQTFLKRAETCLDYEGMESGIILCGKDGSISEREGDFKLSDENCVGGWAKVYRKGRKPTYKRASIHAMKPEYDTPFWNEKKAPSQIVKCAEADALRTTFPTLLGGLYNNEEMMATVTNVTGIAVELKEGAKPASEYFAKREPMKVIEQPKPVEQPTEAPSSPQGASEATKAPEAVPENKVAETPAAGARRQILEANVPFDLFVAELKAQSMLADADSIPSYEEIKMATWAVLATDEKLIKRIIKKSLTWGKA